MNDEKLSFSQVFSELVRAATRPAVTIIFAAVIADGVVCGRDLPTWFLGLAIPTITWWFAERTVTHAIQTKGGSGG